MTFELPRELEEQITSYAAARRTTADKIVVEAVTQFLRGNADDKANVGSPSSTHDSLAIFRKLQNALPLTDETARNWKSAIRESRR